MSAIGPNITTGLLKPAERKIFGENGNLIRLVLYIEDKTLKLLCKVKNKLKVLKIHLRKIISQRFVQQHQRKLLLPAEKVKDCFDLTAFLFLLVELYLEDSTSENIQQIFIYLSIHQNCMNLDTWGFV